ncbi:MAG: RNA-guided pseudouridylation complex pseudouridine synthase subunit Cbf5 [Nanoarchaeota archaeon]|nr:RNA-guided pseudouridylation complex pseudouridine synthase subunit Cbf5 [Nanoarchaeota archaeon]
MNMDIEKLKKQKTIHELLEFGIINIDKPSGPTSFNISDFVRKKLGLRKTSHFGTLDPKVTGVLPIALNRACKLTGFFLGEDKEYVGIMRIHKDSSLEKIEKVIKENFTGKIKQVPPVKSRVKRQEREREIKKFKLFEKNGKDILFLAEVEGGTYIRKLIDDLGKKLGIGAHMLELRRIRAGIFKEEDKEYPLVNLYDFEKAFNEYKKGNEKLLRNIIIPGEIISKLFPILEVKKESLKKLFTGKPIFEDEVKNKIKGLKDSVVCVFSGEMFVGMYKVIDKEHIFAKPMFVYN